MAWTNPGNVVSSDNSRANALMATGTVTDLNVQLSNSGGSGTWGGEDKASGSAWPATTDATATYGGASDLWSQSWSESDVEGGAFGAIVRVQTSNNSQYLWATNYNFALTSGSTIDGIELAIERSTSTARTGVNARVDHMPITVYYTEPAAAWVPKIMLFAAAFAANLIPSLTAPFQALRLLPRKCSQTRTPQWVC